MAFFCSGIAARNQNLTASNKCGGIAFAEKLKIAARNQNLTASNTAAVDKFGGFFIAARNQNLTASNPADLSLLAEKT